MTIAINNITLINEYTNMNNTTKHFIGSQFSVDAHIYMRNLTNYCKQLLYKRLFFSY